MFVTVRCCGVRVTSRGCMGFFRVCNYRGGGFEMVIPRNSVLPSYFLLRYLFV